MITHDQLIDDDNDHDDDDAAATTVAVLGYFPLFLYRFTIDK